MKDLDTKILGALSRFFSTVLSPLLMPAYGVFLALWVSILCYIPMGTRLMVLIVVFGITCILPMVFIALLHSFKVITDKRLVNRNERWLPYIFIELCYIGAAFYLQYVHSPSWLVAFFWGGVIAGGISTIITLWWKISAHAAGVAGVLALLVAIHDLGMSAFSLFGTICVAILLCGCVCSSRIYMKRHTFWQVIAGTANGLICVYLTIMLLA